MKTAPDIRLKELKTATSGMTNQQSRDFENRLIGALSVTAAEEAWASAMATAQRLSERGIEVEAQ